MNERRDNERIAKCCVGTLTERNSPGDKIPIKITQITIAGDGIRFFCKYKLWIDKEFTIVFPGKKHDLSFPIKIAWTKKNCTGYFFGCHKI